VHVAANRRHRLWPFQDGLIGFSQSLPVDEWSNIVDFSTLEVKHLWYFHPDHSALSASEVLWAQQTVGANVPSLGNRMGAVVKAGAKYSA